MQERLEKIIQHIDDNYKLTNTVSFKLVGGNSFYVWRFCEYSTPSNQLKLYDYKKKEHWK